MKMFKLKNIGFLSAIWVLALVCGATQLQAQQRTQQTGEDVGRTPSWTVTSGGGNSEIVDPLATLRSVVVRVVTPQGIWRMGLEAANASLYRIFRWTRRPVAERDFEWSFQYATAARVTGNAERRWNPSAPQFLSQATSSGAAHYGLLPAYFQNEYTYTEIDNATAIETIDVEYENGSRESWPLYGNDLSISDEEGRELYPTRIQYARFLSKLFAQVIRNIDPENIHTYVPAARFLNWVRQLPETQLVWNPSLDFPLPQAQGADWEWRQIWRSDLQIQNMAHYSLQVPGWTILEGRSVREFVYSAMPGHWNSSLSRAIVATVTSKAYVNLQRASQRLEAFIQANSDGSQCPNQGQLRDEMTRLSQVTGQNAQRTLLDLGFSLESNWYNLNTQFFRLFERLNAACPSYSTPVPVHAPALQNGGTESTQR